jgi:hypothetical protein
MGDGGAIADASATLRDLLESEVNSSSLEVTLASPQRVTDESAVTLSLFLYRVTENAHTSTVERRDVDPETVRGGPLSVDLYYLLTAHPGGDGTDSDRAERQHETLGEAMRVLRDNAVVRGSDLRGSLEGSRHAPPVCRFVWGDLRFKSVVESLGKTFTVFTPDGHPVRAEVSIEFKQYRTPTEQTEEEPPSSPDRAKLHTVTEGDSLWALAAAEYGDAGRWRVIADANDVADPTRLEPGRELLLPAIER